MKAIRTNTEVQPLTFERCHDGEGALVCRSLLDDLGSRKFCLMHSDDIPAGVSIGEHRHDDNEEIYYLQSGKGVLIFDGEKYEMLPGDTSVCLEGHSHGFIAEEDCVLIVVGSK